MFLDSNKRVYNFYLCQLNNNIQYISDYFIYIKQYNNILINKHWSNIKESSFTNILPYLQCLDKINFTLPLLGASVVNVSNTYKTDTITISNETKMKKSVSYKTGFIIVTIIVSILFIILCVLLAFWYFRTKRFNVVNDTEQTNDEPNSLMGNHNIQRNDINNATRERSFKLECCFNNKQRIYINVKKTDTMAYVKMLITKERNRNNNDGCVISSIATLAGHPKISDDNKTLKDYGINKDNAIVIVKPGVEAGGNN